MTDETGDLTPSGAIRRLVIVDADHRVRSGLSGLLELSDELAIVAAVGTADEAVAAAAGLQPDAILLDPRLPDVEVGLAVLAKLRRAAPAATVIVLAWTTDVVDDALAAGADVVVDKCADPTPFSEAVLLAVAASPGSSRGGAAVLAGPMRVGGSAAEGTVESVDDPGSETTPRPPQPVAPRPAHP